MREELRALVHLSEIDASARDLEEQLEGIPDEIEERRHAMAALEQLVGAQKAQLDEAIALHEQQQLELKHRTDMLARSRAKGARARTAREADAAEREVEAVRRSIRDGEAERERLEGLIDKTREVLAEPLEELEQQRTALAEAESTVEERLAALRAKRDEVTQGREAYVEKLPKSVMRKYARYRGKLHPVVVPAPEGVCTGCRFALPPQLFNELQKGEELHQCPQCRRFVYYPPVLEEGPA
ncbi:MAG: zinc ribbon domain-containing protein [Sandaracinaceae bacterium]